jgi:hypothetical protein
MKKEKVEEVKEDNKLELAIRLLKEKICRKMALKVEELDKKTITIKDNKVTIK